MKCSICDKDHPVESIELFYRRPDAVVALPDDYRESHCHESDDLAHINWERWFIRCILAIPVIGRQKSTAIGLWVEVAQQSFDAVRELWESPDQHLHPPIAATLANAVYTHPKSLGQAVMVQLTGPTTRPEVYLQDRSSSLGSEQANGIPEERAIQYAMRAVHGAPDA